MADVWVQAFLSSALLVLCLHLSLRQRLLFLQLRDLTAQVLDGLLQLLDHADVLLLQTHRLQHGVLLNLANFFFLMFLQVGDDGLMLFRLLHRILCVFGQRLLLLSWLCRDPKALQVSR